MGLDNDQPEDSLSIDRDLVRRHLRLGWWCLLLFLTLGLLLDALHGFKLGYYLDVSNATRAIGCVTSVKRASLCSSGRTMAESWTRSKLLGTPRQNVHRNGGRGPSRRLGS